MEKSTSDHLEYICRQNVSGFADQLQVEREADRKGNLHRQLLEEEDRYAALSGLQTFLGDKIEEFGRRIDRQRFLVDLLRNNGATGRSLELSLQILDNMIGVRDAFISQLARLDAEESAALVQTVSLRAS